MIFLTLHRHAARRGGGAALLPARAAGGVAQARSTCAGRRRRARRPGTRTGPAAATPVAIRRPVAGEENRAPDSLPGAPDRSFESSASRRPRAARPIRGTMLLAAILLNVPVDDEALAQQPDPPSPPAITEIDVAVYYNAETREDVDDDYWTGNIDALIDLMVAETNAAFDRSGAHVRVRLVDRGEADYEYFGDFFREDWPELGDAVGADIGVAITNDPIGCGGAAGSQAFVYYACEGAAFAHEIGHHRCGVGPGRRGGRSGRSRHAPRPGGGELSYWDTETSGVTRGGGGAGRTTAALQEPTGYTGPYAAWDVDVDGDGDGVSDAPWDFGTLGRVSGAVGGRGRRRGGDVAGAGPAGTDGHAVAGPGPGPGRRRPARPAPPQAGAAAARQADGRAAPVAFTDDPLVPGVTPVRAVHLLELRSRIDALRRRAGLPPFGWTDAKVVPGVTAARALHLTELRSALGEAYAASGRPAPGCTDAAVTPGVTAMRALQLQELRRAV